MSLCNKIGFIQKICILSLLLLCSVQVLAGGGATGVGGGGFAVKVNSQWRLLDLALHPSSQNNCDKPGFKLPKEAFLSYHRLPGVGDKINRLLAHWEAINPKFNLLFKRSLYQTMFLSKSSSFELVPNVIAHKYFVPPRSSHLLSNITPAAWYIPESIDPRPGVVLSNQVYDRMCQIDQVALIVHEGIRGMQLRYNVEFSDELLQRMTAAYVSGLDDDKLLNGNLATRNNAKFNQFDPQSYELAQHPDLMTMGKSPDEQFTREFNRVRICLAISPINELGFSKSARTITKRDYSRMVTLHTIVGELSACYILNEYPELNLWATYPVLEKALGIPLNSFAERTKYRVSVQNLVEAIINSRNASFN